MAAWPVSLPQQGFMDITDSRQNALARSSMDQGAPKVRKKFTAAVRNLSIKMILNGTQRATFDTFYITTTAEGSATFTWTDPVDDSAITCRFKTPPSWSLLANCDGSTTATRIWESKLELEILP
ncbi:MAG: hypothetical protein HOG49_18215 [Candidatus Scalindua sp.]|jgi:hypothetical protein|nr:hypothetical protein [Candidatus Scalindua sp.]